MTLEAAVPSYKVPFRKVASKTGLGTIVCLIQLDAELSCLPYVEFLNCVQMSSVLNL